MRVSAMRSAVLFTFLLLIPRPVKASESQCDDATVWQDWEERTANNPDDSDLQTLHALWLGLCVRIHREGLTVD
jgi:hypothetical protein